MTLMPLFAAAVLAVAPADECEVTKAADQIAGAWKIEYTTPDYESLSSIVLVGRERNKLVAWRVTDEGRQAFDKVILEGETLCLSIKPKEHYGDVTATLKAQLNGKASCRGVIEYDELGGESGQIDFTGKQLDPKSFDQVTQWKLDFVGPDEMRRQPTVTVVSANGRDYAWYSGQEFDLPATKLTIDGDRATMKITATTDEGEQVDVTFRGKIDDDRVAGEASWKTKGDSGSFPFEGSLEK